MDLPISVALLAKVSPMIETIRNSSFRIFLLLLIATATTFQLNSEVSIGTYAGAWALLIAYIKGRLIALEFMEIRHAPLLWRWAIEAWLLIVSATLIAIHLIGILDAGVV
jgi:hypothetical protein